MEWISVLDDLPKPFEIVWIYWRDREVLLGCRTYEGKEEKECLADEGWYSLEDGKCRWTLCWQYYRIWEPSPPSKEFIDEIRSKIDANAPPPNHFDHLMDEFGTKIVISEKMIGK